MLNTNYSTEELDFHWQKVLEKIKDEHIFDDVIFDSYIKSSKLIEINSTHAIIEVPWELNKNFIITYIGEFENRLTTELLHPIKCDVVIKGQHNQNNLYNNIDTAEEKITSEGISKIFKTANHISEFYTFDNFIQGKSNQKSYSAAYGCAQSSEPNFFNPIFIYGNSGLGKTHLLHAVCNYLKENRPDATYLYIDGNDLIAELINATKNRTVTDVINQLSDIDYLLIDDIQHLAKTNDTQEVFFNLYNKIFNNHGQIILTSDVYPSELKSMNNRIVSRFTSGLSVCIDPPEFSTAISILHQKISISKENLKISDEAINYIAKNFSKDVRELEGAFNELLFNAVLFKTEVIDIDFVYDVFKEKPMKVINSEITPKLIKKEVCNFYNINVDQIESKSRTKNIANPRKIAIYLCREILDMSYDKIGKEFGNRDHSTIMNSYNSIVKLLENDSTYQEAISKLKQILGC